MGQQTGVVNQARLLSGGGEFYYGPSTASLTRIGAYRGAIVESKRESTKVTFDNDELNKFKRGDEFAFKFKLGEIDPDTLAAINAGWITKTAVAGTLLSGQTMAITNPTALTLNEITGQNFDIALLTLASVVGSVNAVLVANTDYVLVKGPNGKTNIYFKSGGAISTMTQTFTITYSYTPPASTNLAFSKTGIATSFVARFIHERPDGKQVIIDLNKVQNLTGLSIDWVGNGDDDVATTDVELWGYITGFNYSV